MLYGLALWLYPAEFRRTFGGELVVTFRSRVDDVLNHGGIGEWLAFAAHIVWDTLHASLTVSAAGPVPGSVSLLGLIEGEVAQGGLPGPSTDVLLLFPAAGVALALGGWYAVLRHPAGLRVVVAAVPASASRTSPVRSGLRSVPCDRGCRVDFARSPHLGAIQERAWDWLLESESAALSRPSR